MKNFTTLWVMPATVSLLFLNVVGVWAQDTKPIEKWQAMIEAAGYAYQASRPHDAQKLLEEAVGMTQPGTEGRAAVLNNLAIALETNGYLDAAEQLYNQVIGLWTELYGPAHTNVSRTLGNLGDFYHTQGRFADAIEAYSVAIATAEQATNPDAETVRRALYGNLSKLYSDMGRDEDAASARDQAVPPEN